MKNNKLSIVPTMGQGIHIHNHNCGDICRSSMYGFTRKYKKDIDILESPFKEYSNVEFTILAKQTGVKPNGCPSEIALYNCDVEMISPNQYIIVDWDGRDVENEEYYSHDDNGNRTIYDLVSLKNLSCFTDWQDAKVFPCVKKAI